MMVRDTLQVGKGKLQIVWRLCRIQQIIIRPVIAFEVEKVSESPASTSTGVQRNVLSEYTQSTKHDYDSRSIKCEMQGRSSGIITCPVF